MPRNYWKWTAPLLCVTCLGWVYSQEKEGKPAESSPTYDALPTYEAPRAKSSPRNPLTSEQPAAVPTPPGRPSHIDQGDSFVGTPAAVPTRNHFRVRAVPRSVPTNVFVPMTDEEVALQQEYFNAVTVLKSDEPSEVTRKQAKDKLVEVWGKMMDADQEARKKEVTTLEKRVTKMRAQFDKRKAAQDQIIDLRMKTIQNEADGLMESQMSLVGEADVNVQFTHVKPIDSDEEGGFGGAAGVEGDESSKRVIVGDGLLGFGRGGMLARRGPAEEDSPNNLTPEIGDRAQPGLRRGGEDDGPRSRPMRAKVVYRTVIEEARVEIPPAELAENQQYESALKVLKSDEGDAAKEAARKTIRQLLVTRFTRDLESREKDLVDLEARVTRLREKLNKRAAARDQIIDLQMTTLQNDIDGLGFDGFQESGVEVLRESDDGLYRIIRGDSPAEGKPVATPPSF